MEKKYIVIIVVVVALWAAFMGYRHMKKNEAGQAHQKDTYSRIIEMAKKSPRSGLFEMADALKRYYADNNAYPPALADLYPKYMPSKAFIEQIDWTYEPLGDNFSLTKSATFNNQTMMASIDGAMRPEVESSGAMVATRKPLPKRRTPLEDAQVEAPELFEEAISEGTVIEVVGEREMTLKEAEVVLAAVSPELKREDVKKRNGPVNVQNELSRIITLVGEEAVTKREAEIGYKLERYMVWKDRDGSIGVSNVEFPDKTDMYVAVRNRWYSVTRRQQNLQQTGETEATAAVVAEQKSIEEIATDFSRSYLVWKEDSGEIGIGNMQYPEKESLVVASRNGWDSLQREIVPETAPVAALKTPDSGRQTDMDQVAADVSKQYLVWKDENGVIGVGNMQYPEKERLVVASRGEWTVLEEASVPQTAAPPASREEQQDDKRLASGFSGQYLMWKDKNGQVGFGNVQYPEMRDIVYIHAGDSWQKVAN